MINVPRMLLVGATGRNAGKTVLAAELIRRFSARAPVIGAKVTAIAERDGQCPRGGKGCGVCTSLEGAYCITREEEGAEGKDTQRLLSAGAQRVYWLRVLKPHLEEGARALLDQAGADAWVVCESNSLRTVVKPGLFIMVTGQGKAALKPSAEVVYDKMDLLARFDGQGFDFDLNRIRQTQKGWALVPASRIERSKKRYDTV